MDDGHIERQVVVAIRRIIRAVDQHSRKLALSYGLTAPQLVLLQEISGAGTLTTGELARRAYLAQGTVSEILDRLEDRGLVTRKRSRLDHRRIECSLSQAGRELVERRPPLIQDRLASELGKLGTLERHFILSALERIAAMMQAETLEAAPILVSGPPTVTVDKTVDFLEEEPKK
jgi:DNA-binding MarR family transcriptional regulator